MEGWFVFICLDAFVAHSFFFSLAGFLISRHALRGSQHSPLLMMR